MRPTEVLRNLALSLERLATEEAASSAVRGTAEGLRRELPELDGQVRALLRDTLAVLGRMTREAAQREPGAGERMAHGVAAAAMRGALEELEREWHDGGLPAHGLLQRLNLLLDGVIDFATSRSEALRRPGDRARLAAVGAVEGLAGQLEGLAPLGATVAAQVGRGLVEGLEAGLQERTATLAHLMECAGRGLIRGMSSELQEALARQSGGVGEQLGPPVAALAERSAAAVVRGAAGELTRQLQPLEGALRGGALGRVSGELTRGVLSAFGERLRGRAGRVVSAGAALVTATWMLVRLRQAVRA